MNEETPLLFSWKDSWEPINIFYYNNWYWKTTLFNFIKATFTWKQIKETFIDTFEMKIILNSMNYILTNWPWKMVQVLENKKDITYNKFKNILEKQILKRHEKLIIEWNNKKWEQVRNRLESLLRFNFFTDDEFKKYTQKSCSLINSDFDWDTKWIFLNYILWEDFNVEKEKIFKVAFKYWSKQKFIKNTNSIWEAYPEQFEDTSWQASLFLNPEEEFNESVRKKFTIKDTLFQIESIIEKLRFLELDVKKFLNNNKLVLQLIKTELKDILIQQKKYEKEYKSISHRIQYLKDNFWDIIKWIPTDIQGKIKQRRSALQFVEKYKKDIETYYNNANPLFNEYLRWFLHELTTPLFNSENINFHHRDLKLSIWWWSEEKKWDWRLKTLRFLALVWIILLKSIKWNSRNLWIWFFDSPFYWVDMKNSIWAIESISDFIDKKSIKSQLFIFATKEESEWVVDTFERTLSKNKNVYFHEYDYKNKKYLISE